MLTALSILTMVELSSLSPVVQMSLGEEVDTEITLSSVTKDEKLFQLDSKPFDLSYGQWEINPAYW